MTFGSIFTGIGAGDYGLEQAGWVVRWQVEPAPFRRAVLEAHWPGLQRFWDMKDRTAAPGPPVDLIYGELPDTNPAWWDEVFALVEALKTPFWLLEASPIRFGAAEQAELRGRFSALGYHAAARSVGFAGRMRGHVGPQEIVCTLKRQRLFLVAGPPFIMGFTELRPDDGRQPQALAPLFQDRPVLEEVEALLGLPMGWSCLCASSPCRCEGRPLAVDEATVVHLLAWIGRWLRDSFIP